MVEGEKSITVNGKRVYVRREVLPYADAVALAGYGPNAAAARPVVRVKYPGPATFKDHNLGPGEYAMVSAGMTLEVGLTSQA
ncbi:MAG TPA: hypothetical protein VGK73_32325 [Polyangiaceae bacterium]